MFTFAEYLRHRRLGRGLTMQALASQLDVTPQFISLLESGRRKPSEEFLQRCAELFGENVDYLRFLAEPIPEEQKRAIYESPLAPEYIPRPGREQTIAGGLDDQLIRQMLSLPGLPALEEDTPYHGSPQAELTEDAVAFHRQLVRYLLEGEYAAHIQGWARLYDVYYTRWIQGRVAALPGFEELYKLANESPSGRYPLRWFYLVALHTGLARQEAGQPEAAIEAFQRTAKWAEEAGDGEGGLIARWLAAHVALDHNDIFRAVELLGAAANTPGAPPTGIARARAERAELLLMLHEDEAALRESQAVAPLWRSSTLDLPQHIKTSSLLVGELIGTEALRRMGRDLEARRWLNRVRSVRTRVETDPLTDLRLRITAAELLRTSNRFNQMRKRYAEMMQDLDRLETGEMADFYRAWVRARFAETQLEVNNVADAERALKGLPLDPERGLIPRRLEWILTVGRARIQLLLARGEEDEARALFQEIQERVHRLLGGDPQWQGSRLEAYAMEQLNALAEPIPTVV